MYFAVIVMPRATILNIRSSRVSEFDSRWSVCSILFPVLNEHVMCMRDKKQQKIKQRESYERNKAQIIQRQKERRQRIVEWIIGLKKDQPCTDCGQVYHFAAMHYDHLPGATKLGTIREMAYRYADKQKILDEIAKCELVCSNCHAVRTYERNPTTYDLD